MTFHTQFTNTGPQTDIELELLLHNPYLNDLKASESSSKISAFYLEKLKSVIFILLGHCWQIHLYSTNKHPPPSLSYFKTYQSRYKTTIT